MKDFEMTQAQLDELLYASRPVPVIALNCGTPPRQQENVNAAWAELGEVMGFDHMTVKPNGKGDRFFSAEEKVHCKGKNCKAVNGIGHSDECENDHSARYFGAADNDLLVLRQFMQMSSESLDPESFEKLIRITDQLVTTRHIEGWFKDENKS